MKKARIFAAAFLSLAVISGCTDDNGSRGNYEEPDAAPTEAEPDNGGNDPTPEVTPEETPTPTPEPEPVIVGLSLTEEEMAERLDGVWFLNDGENMIQDPQAIPDTLTIDSDTMTATYHMAYAAEEAYFDISFEHTFVDAVNSQNGLVLTCTGVTDGFPYQDTDQLYANLYVQVCENHLIVREYGNGLSMFMEEVVGYDRQGWDEWWLFVRDDSARDPIYPYAKIDWDKERKTNSEFYAIRYSDWGNAWDLQEVEVEFYDNIMLYGMESQVMAVRYADNGHPFSVINYDILGAEMKAHSGCYSPSLVEVMTDENGEIIYSQDIPYYGLGFYELPTAQGTSDISRDDSRYDATDAVFLGEWIADDSSSIKITEADPQTGGYYAEISIYRLTQMEAYLNIDGNSLSINQGFAGDDRIGGTIESTAKGIRFTVTESEFDPLEVGTVFEFTKK